MSRFSTPRLMAQGMLRSFTKPQLPIPSTPLWTRLFSQSRALRNEDENESSLSGGMALNQLANNVMGKASGISGDAIAADINLIEEEEEEPYHFHIYSHKHNTHVTLTNPKRDALISLSCGNLGFKKANRKHYDSAYQLGAYVIDKMHQKGLVNKIKKLEVVLRGFGPGREAVTKVLMGNEGKHLRDKIVKVSDSTRLKFGGTRSKRPRRLG
ncbi:hypothetical protein QBC38DRAFT_465444 [Podospora fimiseda]|uniref:Small ribosomal subunit protein uS11m n=1 Tax=Podospora fimiseda TaxID=252190 RepID=A0AAN7BYT4_9PEZI|nr:hypothetical protein QBC38DRAFT_465444 [Podospora fimiseda]